MNNTRPPSRLPEAGDDGELELQPEVPAGASGWQPELAQAVLDLLHPDFPVLSQLREEIEELVATYGLVAYSELIYHLSHLRFAHERAHEHWNGILEHHAEMSSRLEKPVDLRVAVMSYFVEVSRQFENPTAIEVRLLRETQAMVYRDELTGLRNYRFFTDFLEHELLRSGQHNAPLSLLMIDIDDFKAFNDRFGHEAGNQALATVGGLLMEGTRQVDVPARYGGEEFAVIAPATPKLGARALAERVRNTVERHFLQHGPGAPEGCLTVSTGIATFPADGADTKLLIRSADRALYLAKTSGKNQIQLYGQSRRSFQRVQATVKGRLTAPTAETYRLTTLDVGEGGIRFSCDRFLPIGSLLDIRLVLPGTTEEITFAGRVVQSTRSEVDSGYEAAIRFVDIGTRALRSLTRFVHERQPGPPPTDDS